MHTVCIRAVKAEVVSSSICIALKINKTAAVVVRILKIHRSFNKISVRAFVLLAYTHWSVIDPFPIRRATSVPLGKGTLCALHHGKMSTTKRRAIQILHNNTFQFTFKCGYNDFLSKYTDINSLHVTQIDLLHNDTFCSI